MVIRHNFLSS